MDSVPFWIGGVHKGEEFDHKVVYKTLVPQSKQIRLITIEKARWLSDFRSISCRMKVVDLSTKPEFFALSYVWGDPAKNCVIKIDGKRFGVTENLFVALFYLRRAFGPVTVWVDAVCIDQDGTHEKGHQVGLMGDIYRQATKVVAWLGPQYHESNLAMEMFELCYTKATSKPPGDYSWVEDARLKLNDPQTFVAVYRFCARPFWQRVWILQEFVLAKDLCLMVGKHFLDPKCLAPLLRLFEGPVTVWCDASNRGLIRHLADLNSFSWGRILWMSNLRDSHLRESHQREPHRREPHLLESSRIQYHITALVDAAMDFSATEPRDKIYALQGLAVDGLPPDDYYLHIDVLYRNFAKKWMEERNDLSILYSTPITSRIYYPTFFESWIPRWGDVLYSPFYGPRNVAVKEYIPHYRAHGNSTAEFRLSPNIRILYVKGLLIAPAFKVAGSMIGDWGKGMAFLDTFKDFFAGRVTLKPDCCTEGELTLPPESWRLHAFIQSLFMGLDPATRTKLEPTSKSYAELAAQFCRYALLNDFETEDFISSFLSILIHPYLLTLENSRLEENRLIAMSQISAGGDIEPERPFRLIMAQIGLRNIFITSEGYLCTAFMETKSEDVICILFGLSMPVILRPVGTARHPIYKFLGFCYLAGAMNGELLDDVGSSVEFTIA
jgi:hypothetical protein